MANKEILKPFIRSWEGGYCCVPGDAGGHTKWGVTLATLRSVYGSQMGVADLKAMTEEQWDEVLRVNLKSVFNYTHAVTPIMLRARKGSIISLASIVGVSGNPAQANYAASKAGIIAFTKSIAKEFGARGVRANAVAPGYIDTAMTQALPQEVRDGFVQRIPMHRAGTPDEVAQVVLFLASDMSSYVSGQVIAIDGAMG